MGALSIPKLSVEEYLAMDRAAELPCEYHDGEVFPIEAASWRHASIARNTIIALTARLEGKPCEALAAPLRVRVQPTKFLYPDLLVVCGKPVFTDEQVDTLRNPKVIIEILSPSTEGYDYSRKFELYRGLESFEEYVLIAQDRAFIDVFRRQPDNSWLLHSYSDPAQAIELKALGITVTIAELHAGVSYPEE